MHRAKPGSDGLGQCGDLVGLLQVAGQRHVAAAGQGLHLRFQQIQPPGHAHHLCASLGQRHDHACTQTG